MHLATKLVCFLNHVWLRVVDNDLAGFNPGLQTSVHTDCLAPTTGEYAKVA